MDYKDFEKEYKDYIIQYEDPKLYKWFGLEYGVYLNIRPWEFWMVYMYGEFNKNDCVLDAGALHTYFSLYISQFVNHIDVTDSYYWAERDYYNTDTNVPRIEDWARHLETSVNNIKVSQADIQNLYFEDNTFDKIMCISVMEHVLDDKKGMKEFIRVLKPGGKLLITVEYDHYKEKEYSEEDGSYFRLYSKDTIGDLINVEGSKVIACIPQVPFTRGNLFFCLTKI